ncbi:MAG: DUF4173 domain-containing protein [Acidobacteriota bacterium]|nr:DUF4173 domain-containing protein [Acidobacteriota bacterium]
MDRHRTAVVIAVAALILGVAGDALLRWIPWGLNALLWTTLFCVAAQICARATRFPSTADEGADENADENAVTARRVARFPMVCALLVAIGIFWRDSEVLVGLDVLLLLLFLSMLALEARGVRLQAAGLAEIGAAVIVTGAQSVAGLFQLPARDLTWSRMPRVGVRGTGVVLRGTLIAAPALIIFGSLFASADPEFGSLLRELIRFDPAEAFQHLFMTVLIAAICAGFLRSLALSGEMPRPGSPSMLSLPSAETNFALGLVNLLFLLFVATQFRYFFDATPENLTQYARRGFFELVWVVALVVPMLLLAEWLVAKDRGVALFRGLAGLQVALVFIIAGSAFYRMKLYRDEFGLTRLRFFTTAFMIWVAVLLIWFVCTVLTGRRRRFAIGALATGMAAVVALHAINPDNIIAESNVARTRTTQKTFDSYYTLNLSDDAAATILANADIVGPEVVQRVLRRHRPTGWRTWNMSRAKARELARRYESKATPPIARP